MLSNSLGAGVSLRTSSFFTHIQKLASLILAVLLLPGLSDHAHARTLHVDVNSPGGNGSAKAPLGSIGRAVALARPGDIVLVHPGVYSGQVKIHTSGRQGAPIVIKGERGAIIDGRRKRVDTLVEILGSHVVFEGFRVQNASRTGIGLWGTSGVVVRKNVVVSSQGAGIWVGHDRRGRSGRNIIEYNVVTANCQMNRARNRKSGWPAGIAIAVSDQSIVRMNRVYENYGEGIGVMSSNAVEVSSNTVYDNFSVNIYLDNAPSTRVQANTIGSTGNREFFRYKRPPASVLIANERTALHLPSRDISVISNTMVGVGDVYYGTYGMNTGLHASILAPNLVQTARWFVPTAGVPGI